MWSPSEARVVFQLTAAEADSEPLPAAAYGINLNCFHLPGPPFPCLVLQKKNKPAKGRRRRRDGGHAV